MVRAEVVRTSDVAPVPVQMRDRSAEKGSNVHISETSCLEEAPSTVLLWVEEA